MCARVCRSGSPRSAPSGPALSGSALSGPALSGPARPGPRPVSRPGVVPAGRALPRRALAGRRALVGRAIPGERSWASSPGRALLGRAPAVRASVDLPPVGRTRWPASTPRHARSSRMPAAAHRVGASGPGVPDTVTGRRHRPDSTGNAEVRRSHRVLPAATSDEPHSAAEAHGSASRAPGTRRRGPHRPGRPRREETSTRSPCPCGAYGIATRLIPQRGRTTPGLPHPQATRSRDRARRVVRRPPRPPSLFHVKHRRRPPRTRSPAVPRPPERAAGPSSARATRPRAGRPVPLVGRARPMGTPYDRRPGPTTSRSTRDHHR
ncbi:hypothetical protein ATL51_3338 [Pseudonocardia alni]|uniref:Uncharacterized protein n=1 Tax=Pseudonocardia alni TaxID=33907 RepID=A0AA44ZQ98_PSEA5|nr:hypothetical protein ATL51_3338 [Pseudonocardia alni]